MNTGHTPFQLNFSFYSKAFFKENTDLCFKSKSADIILTELQELMTICHKNIYYAQKVQKQAYNKGINIKNYAQEDKIWLNSKYIKTKQNQKLEAKFFGPF